MEITFLGTSAAIPTSTRGLPSIHVKDSNTSVLLDCGDGTTKTKIIKWIDELNDVRKDVAHASKLRSPSKEDRDFVRAVKDGLNF